MTTPPKSIALPRHLSVSIKLGGGFLLLAIIATGNLYFSNKMHDSIANIAGIINQSGQLRYLSQKIAFNSASFVMDGEAARQSEMEGENAFNPDCPLEIIIPHSCPNRCSPGSIAA